MSMDLTPLVGGDVIRLPIDKYVDTVILHKRSTKFYVK